MCRPRARLFVHDYSRKPFFLSTTTILPVLSPIPPSVHSPAYPSFRLLSLPTSRVPRPPSSVSLFNVRTRLPAPSYMIPTT